MKSRTQYNYMLFFSKTFIPVYSAPRKSENTVIANSGVNLLMAANKKDMV